MPKKTKISDIFFPKSFLKAVEEGLGEEYLRLSNGKQKGYIVSFWDNQDITKLNKHNRSKDINVFPFGHETIERNFGDHKAFSALNNTGYYLKPSNTDHGYAFSRSNKEGYKYFEPTKWLAQTDGKAFQSWEAKNIKGSKQGYKLAPKVEQIILDWKSQKRSESTDQCGFINTNGVRPEDYPEAIQRQLGKQLEDTNVNTMVTINRNALKTHQRNVEMLMGFMTAKDIDTVEMDSQNMREAKGLTKGKETNVPNQVRVSKDPIWVKGMDGYDSPYSLGGVKTIDSHLNSINGLFDKPITMDGLISRLRQISRLLASENSTYPVTYTEASTGRYTSNGAVLQGYHRSVRYAALGGCYEYDLEAAHQNILLQVLERDNKDFEELDTVREYVKNKKQIRIDLAAELGTSVTTIKKVLNALTYGAQLTTDKNKSIYTACNGDEVLTRRVVDNLWLKRLSRVPKKAYKALVGDNTSVTNILNITREISPPVTGKIITNKQKKSNGSKMNMSASIAHILQGYERQILDAVIKHSNQDHIALLVHDCVVFYTQQSPKELSRIVMEETGFDIEFSEDRY